MKKGWTNYFGERGEFVDENGVLNKTIDDKVNDLDKMRFNAFYLLLAAVFIL